MKILLDENIDIRFKALFPLDLEVLKIPGGQRVILIPGIPRQTE